MKANWIRLSGHRGTIVVDHDKRSAQIVKRNIGTLQKANWIWHVFERGRCVAEGSEVALWIAKQRAEAKLGID